MLAGGLQDRGIRPSFLAVSDGDQGKEVKNDSGEEQQSAQSCKHEKRQRSLPRQAECFHQQAKNKEYAGELRDVLEIDGTISHQKACELEDVIWAHMDNVSHLRPDRLSQLGLFYAGNILRQSDPLALTQLIILYHVVNKMHEAASEETL